MTIATEIMVMLSTRGCTLSPECHVQYARMPCTVSPEQGVQFTPEYVVETNIKLILHISKPRLPLLSGVFTFKNVLMLFISKWKGYVMHKLDVLENELIITI
jgi:hypothetical protein